MVEKAAGIGGSTAMSGGGIWIPNNPTPRKEGQTDDVEDVRHYLRAVVGDRVAADRIDAYVDCGLEVLEMMHRVSRHMEFSWCPGYSDYHPELPGGRAAGRTIQPRPIDVRKLGDEERKLLALDVPMPLGLWFTGYEARNLMMIRREWKARRMLGVAAWRVVSRAAAAPWLLVLRSGLVANADTLRELAEKIAVPPDALEATVARFNGFAAKGRDEDCGRGDSPYDNYYGDHSLPNPNLDTIDGGPFYAIRIGGGGSGHQGRRTDGRSGPRAAAGRQRDPWSVRHGQRIGRGDGQRVRRGRSHDWSRHGVQLPGDGARGEERRGLSALPRYSPRGAHLTWLHTVICPSCPSSWGHFARFLHSVAEESGLKIT